MMRTLKRLFTENQYRPLVPLGICVVSGLTAGTTYGLKVLFFDENLRTFRNRHSTLVSTDHPLYASTDNPPNEIKSFVSYRHDVERERYIHVHPFYKFY